VFLGNFSLVSKFLSCSLLLLLLLSCFDHRHLGTHFAIFTIQTTSNQQTNTMPLELPQVPVSELKPHYAAFIKKRDLLSVYCGALQETRKWKGKNAEDTHTTTGVNATRQLRLVHQQLKEVCDKPILMTIDGVLPELMCFHNSHFLEEHAGWKRKGGYTVTACPCGAHMTFEAHSVNMTPQSRLVDWTKDFNGEKQKWFIPFKCDVPVQTLVVYGAIPTICSRGQDRCRCAGDKYSDTGVAYDFEKFVATLKNQQ